jgi:hypothetical protein
MLEVREEALHPAGVSAEEAQRLHFLADLVRRHRFAGIPIHGVATFLLSPCFDGSARGKIAMRTMTDFYFQRALPVLRRNPKLTAMMVYSAGICIAVSIAAFAIWRLAERPPLEPTESPHRQSIHIRALI